MQRLTPLARTFPLPPDDMKTASLRSNTTLWNEEAYATGAGRVNNNGAYASAKDFDQTMF